MSNVADTPLKEFTHRRVLDAPRALVWDTITKSEHLVHWWGPKGTSVRVHCLDLVPGGLFHYSLATPDGKVMWGKWIYREIVPGSRLVFIASFSDELAGITAHPMAPDWPKEVLSTFDLTEEDGKTTIHMTGVPVKPTAAERAMFEGAIPSLEGGWNGTWSVLDDYLRLAKKGEGEVGDREYVITRVIDAPREKIFDAWADKERIARWWGPKGFSSTISAFDFKPAGKWTFVMHGPDGKDYPNESSFVEVQRPSRIVVRHGSDPKFQIAATLEDLGNGKTKVVWRGTFDTAETLAKVRSYALPGAIENLEKLAAEVERTAAS